MLRRQALTNGTRVSDERELLRRKREQPECRASDNNHEENENNREEDEYNHEESDNYYEDQEEWNERRKRRRLFFPAGRCENQGVE